MMRDSAGCQQCPAGQLSRFRDKCSLEDGSYGISILLRNFVSVRGKFNFTVSETIKEAKEKYLLYLHFVFCFFNSI